MWDEENEQSSQLKGESRVSHSNLPTSTTSSSFLNITQVGDIYNQCLPSLLFWVSSVKWLLKFSFVVVVFQDRVSLAVVELTV